MAGDKDAREPLWHGWFPYGICALLLIPDLYWVLRDQSVWHWDQAWYGEVSVDLWYTLRHAPLSWPGAMLRAFGSKAPGIAWIGQFFVPFGRWAGAEETVLLLSVLLAALAVLVLTYKTGLALTGGRREAAWSGTLFTAGAPLFVAMSHQYMVEMLQTLAVAYLFWIAASRWELSRPQVVGHLILAGSLGMLAKSSTPLYGAFPVLVALHRLFSPEKKPVREYGGLPVRILFTAGLPVAAAMAGWYALNLRPLVGFLRVASSSSVALHYGTAGTLPAKLAYWTSAAGSNFFFPLTGLGFGLLLLAAAGLAWGRRTEIEVGHAGLVLAAAGMDIVIALVVFSFQINQEQRYLLPLAPAAAVLLTWVVALPKRRAIAWAACLLAVVQFVQSQAQGLGFARPNPRVAHWLRHYDPDPTAREEVTRLVRQTSGPEAANRYNMTGMEIPWLNANSLSFYQAKYRLVCGRRAYFTSLGFAQNSLPDALRRIDELRIVYFTSLEEDRQPRPPDFLNRVAAPVLRRIEADPHFVREPFPSRLGILLFRRVEAGTHPAD